MITCPDAPRTLDELRVWICQEAQDFRQYLYAAGRALRSGAPFAEVPTADAPVSFAGQVRPFSEWDRWRGTDLERLALASHEGYQSWAKR